MGITKCVILFTFSRSHFGLICPFLRWKIISLIWDLVLFYNIYFCFVFAINLFKPCFSVVHKFGTLLCWLLICCFSSYIYRSLSYFEKLKMSPEKISCWPVNVVMLAWVNSGFWKNTEWQQQKSHLSDVMFSFLLLQPVLWRRPWSAQSLVNFFSTLVDCFWWNSSRLPAPNGGHFLQRSWDTPSP